MLDARARIQSALDRSGVSLRRRADVSGVITSSQLSKYLRGVTCDTQHARAVVETAEALADLIERGELFPTDTVERMQAAIAEDRACIEAAAEALRLLDAK
jgi:hypothetical protein